VRQALITAPGGGGDLVAALRADPAVAAAITEADLEQTLDPAGYTGAAGILVDRVLAAHTRR
jgi:3-carboxy-cis,cis-muconate cycloisomerase